ncbi:MAG: hypothetical protein EOO46_21740 [Flavobacterium sp.]|nr:MAG: hypothetical protein EOO46_21740 [Flavobacterium sp.]
MDKSQLEDLAAFIREQRSSESNFEKIYAKLEEVNNDEDPEFKSAISDIKEKGVPTYQKAKEASGTAWPEFEKFVSEFEKTVTEAIKKAA